MLDFDVKFLKGVGPNRALKLNRLGIYSVEDLLNYFPVKYEDRRVVKKIGELKEETKALLKIKMYDSPRNTKIKRNLNMIKIVVTDGTGFMNLTFFNQGHLMDKLNQNEWYYVFGEVKLEYGKPEMTNPEIELEVNDNKAGKIMPIYGLTYNLTNNEITKIIKNALESYYEKIDDIIPEYIKNEYNLISRKNAIRFLHFPQNRSKYSIAKKTIAFEKLMIMQMGLLSIKSKLVTNSNGIQIKNTELADKLIDSLSFKLTNAQYRVISEIKEDMAVSKTMNRLVQGDVGSGKTIIAIYAMLVAFKSGFQSSMMAPTEILAMQHYETIKEYVKLANLEINVSFLSGSTKTKQKIEILNKLKNGDIDILIGTHALIEDNVEFYNIGLVITDEQHRFGVRQRAYFSNKGENPDILVMTATPIPRTLALMLYGDLDISIIDELPAGRQTIKTYVVGETQKNEMYSFIDKKVNGGNQAYIVAPLVEESDNLEVDSAKEIYEELATTYFSKYKVGLLYGSMKSADKEKIINDFYNGKINILVSTTVIEVGVNVPNAVIMMILNSERFGLAQLHQLRGRVGRGTDQSYCILVNTSKSKKSKDRMNILTKTNDGFLIAEEDLKIRGPGDFFGTAQHGLSKYDIKNIISDIDVVQEVTMLSKKIIKDNPSLEGFEYINLKKYIINLFKDENIVFN